MFGMKLYINILRRIHTYIYIVRKKYIYIYIHTCIYKIVVRFLNLLILFKPQLKALDLFQHYQLILCCKDKSKLLMFNGLTATGYRVKVIVISIGEV
jgi:hypothetical protein